MRLAMVFYMLVMIVQGWTAELTAEQPKFLIDSCYRKSEQKKERLKTTLVSGAIAELAKAGVIQKAAVDKWQAELQQLNAIVDGTLKAKHPDLTPEELFAIHKKSKTQIRNRAWNALSEEISEAAMRSLVQEANWRYLMYYCERDVNDVSLLNTECLKNELRLTGSQQDLARRAMDKHQSVEAKLKEKYLIDADSIMQKRRDAIDRLFSPKQREQLKMILGEPIDYVREELTYRNIPDIALQPPKVQEKNGRRLDKSQHNQDGKTGKPEVDAIWLQLMRENMMARELELTADQVHELLILLQKINQESDLVVDPNRISKLIEQRADQSDELEEVLLPAQLKRLPQVELQLRLGFYRSSCGLLHPQMAKFLNIGPDIRNEIASILQESDQQLNKRQLEFYESIQRLDQEIFRAGLDMLSANQREAYDNLLPGRVGRNYKLAFPIRVQKQLKKQKLNEERNAA